jgi:hypothetical protein
MTDLVDEPQASFVLDAFGDSSAFTKCIDDYDVLFGHVKDLATLARCAVRLWRLLDLSKQGRALERCALLKGGQGSRSDPEGVSLTRFRQQSTIEKGLW